MRNYRAHQEMTYEEYAQRGGTEMKEEYGSSYQISLTSEQIREAEGIFNHPNASIKDDEPL